MLRLLIVARWLGALFSVLGGYLCYWFAAESYGTKAGCLSLMLWCFSPGILGNGTTIIPDVPAAAIGTAAVFCFWRWLRNPQWLEAIVAGLVLGLAELTKFTLVVFYPMLPTIWAVYRLSEWKTRERRNWLRQGGMFAVIVLLSMCVINCCYLFEGSFRPLQDFRFQSTMFTGYGCLKDVPSGGANRFAGTWLGKLPLPLPANMIQGIDTQRYDFEQGCPSYLRGQWAEHGWWYYYLYALAIKEPLGTWCLVAVAVGGTVADVLKTKPSAHLREVGDRRGCAAVPSPVPKAELRLFSASWRDEMVVLAPFFTILIFVSSQTGFSAHSRYAIPALPFLFVWTSKVGRFFEMRPFTNRRLAIAVTIVIALTWSVGGSLAIYPHSLSYFNELAVALPTPVDASNPKATGGNDECHSVFTTIRKAIGAGPRNGPRHLLDSNIDWGQDLFYLEDWYKSHPEARPIKVAYFGSYPLDRSIVKSAGSPPSGPDREQIDDKTERATVGPLPGWYALSVNNIYSRDRQYRYFLNFEPVAMAGYSIYIYHITPDEANRVRRELGLKELSLGGSKEKEAGNGSND